MRLILNKLTRQQLRDLAEVHGIYKGRNKYEAVDHIDCFIEDTDRATLKEILTYITACL